MATESDWVGRARSCDGGGWVQSRKKQKPARSRYRTTDLFITNEMLYHWAKRAVRQATEMNENTVFEVRQKSDQQKNQAKSNSQNKADQR